MSYETKIIYATDAQFTNSQNVTESGTPSSVGLQGLSANTGYYTKAELWENGGLQDTSGVSSFMTLQAGTITLTHYSTERKGYDYLVTYSYTSTYAPSWATLSTNLTTFQGTIYSANNKVSFLVTGLTPGDAYLTEVTMGDIYGETATVTGSIVTTVVNEISITDVLTDENTADIALEYVVDSGFYTGWVDWWYASQDPTQDTPLGKEYFNDGDDVVTISGLTSETEYKFRASITLSDQTTTINSEVTEGRTETEYYSKYFTIENTSGQSNTIGYTTSGGMMISGIDVSTDDGENWTRIPAGNRDTIATLGADEKVLIRHNGALGDSNIRVTLTATRTVKVYGNIASLTHGSNFMGDKVMPDYAFRSLFYYQENVTDASDISFASYISVGESACADMFAYTSITESPKIPAVNTLATGCFQNMFAGCSRLTTAPVLPATTLAIDCYAGMFSLCTSLTRVPNLPATTLALRCYSYMFRYCTSITTPPQLPATALADQCYEQMFEYCTSLTTAPSLPATTLSYGCYDHMFGFCDSLTSAPSLHANVLAINCYAGMFNYCTSLTTAPALPATTMMSYCYSRMFEGCSSLTSAPQLQATVLAYGCYSNMFYGCESLATAPSLPATTLARECYLYMFGYCSSLSTAPALPSTDLEEKCYYGMFACCGITTAPNISHVTHIESESLRNMYAECTSLTTAYAPSISAWNTNDSKSWLFNVAASGTLYKPEELNIPTGTPDGVPSGWETQDY